MKYKFDHAAIGGTWDHLHIGHKKLIDRGFIEAERVSIGVTSDQMLTGKVLPASIQVFTERKKALHNYLRSKNYLKRVTFHTLHDIFGPTLTDSSLDSLVITPNLLASARRIHLQRKKRKMPILHILKVSLVKGEGNEVITSSKIRQGLIDQDGRSNLRFWQKKEVLLLPDSLRPALRKPLGVIVKGPENNLSKATQKLANYIKRVRPTMTIAVGDVVSSSLLKSGVKPNVRVIDHRTQRKEVSFIFPPNSQKTSMTPNPPGTITTKLALTVQRAITASLSTHRPQYVIVKGEEDLAALPAIMLSPLYSLVVYGQRNLGMIATLVTPQTKKKVSTLLEKFL